ncbi:MAG: hypothetical protein IKL76_03280 [Clostridia bacterium]|nr:hypothetical protein [Clostridia bacterium]
MTKFDGYMERLEEKRRIEKEEKMNEWFLRSLQTRTKEDVIKELSENLTFIIGVSAVAIVERVKTHVF